MTHIATIKLGDGGGIDVSAASGEVHLAVYVNALSTACVDIPARVAAEVRDALSSAIVAAGRTQIQLNGDMLAGSLRHTLCLLDEFKKQSPAEVEGLYEMLISHARSSCPSALNVLKETL